MLEAKTRLSELVKAVQAGEEVTIANRGEPVARLMPARKRGAGKARTGEAREVLAWLQAHPAPEQARRSLDQIEADIAAERDAWD